MCTMRMTTLCVAPLHLHLLLRGKKGEYITCLIATKNFASTNITRRFPGRTCVNTKFSALATLRQLCSWRSNVGRKGRLPRGFLSLGLATLVGDLKHERLQTTRSEGASVGMQEAQWHKIECKRAVSLRIAIDCLPCATINIPTF